MPSLVRCASSVHLVVDCVVIESLLPFVLEGGSLGDRSVASVGCPGPPTWVQITGRSAPWRRDPHRSLRQARIGSDLEADSAFASSLRELMPSFWKTLCRWYSTVRGLR